MGLCTHMVYNTFQRVTGSEVLGVGRAHTAVCNGFRCMIVAHNKAL